MPIPDGDKASEHLLLKKMDPYGGDFYRSKEGDNYERRKEEKGHNGGAEYSDIS